ncbi:hypothetical protein ABPG72_011942 [Tetrahymena utriculariae]
MIINDINYQQQTDQKQLKDLKHRQYHVIHQWYIYLLTVNACLGTWFYGFNLGAFNAVQKIMQKTNSWSTNEFTLYTALITAAMPFGALVGAFCVKYTIPLLKGVRRSLVFFDYVAIIGTIILILQSQVANLIIGRFISGFCVGQNTALVPMYIIDFAPKEVSGRVGSINQFFQAFGVFSSYLFSLFLPLPSNLSDGYSDQIPWRIAMGAPIIAPIIRLILFTFLFKIETPTILMKQHKYTELKQYIHNIYKEQDCDDVFHDIEDKVISEQEQAIRKKQALSQKGHGQKEVETMKIQHVQSDDKKDEIILTPESHNVNEIKQKSLDDYFKEKIYDLCSNSSYKSRLLLGCIISFTTQFCGVNGINFYSNSIFLETSGKAGAVGEEYARYSTIGMGASMVSYNFISFYLQGRFGRKFLMQLGTIIIIITQLLIGILNTLPQNDALGKVNVFLIYLFQFGWQIGLGAVTWIISPEILDPAQVSISTAIRWTSAMTIGLVFPYLIIYCNLYGTFFIFTVFTISACIYFQIYIKETKGKDCYEIMKSYCDPKKYVLFQKEATEYSQKRFEEQEKFKKQICNQNMELISEKSKDMLKNKQS